MTERVSKLNRPLAQADLENGALGRWRYLEVARSHGAGRWHSLGIVGSVLAVAALDYALWWWQPGAATSSVALLDIFVVVGAGLLLSTAAAVAAAVASICFTAWLFAEPLEVLWIHDWREWVVVLSLLVVALVVGRLTEHLRHTARLAEAREAETRLSSELLGDLSADNLAEALHAAVATCKFELNLEALRLTVKRAGSPPLVIELGPVAQLEKPHGSVITRRLDPDNLNAAQSLRRTLLPWLFGAAGRQPAPGGRLHYRQPFAVADQASGELAALTNTATAYELAVVQRALDNFKAQLQQRCEHELIREKAIHVEVMERSGELKTALLRTVSHEFRTPLAGILTASATLLEEGELPPRDRHELTLSINGLALRLHELVNNLLDLSRIEAGMLEPVLDWFELADLFEELERQYARQLSEGSLVLQLGEHGLLVLADYVRTRQIMVSLIDNAYKHTPAGTRVAARAERRSTELELVVEDDGPGVSEKTLNELFLPFRQFGALAGREQSNGLGMAIVEGLVKAHGGEVSAANRLGGGLRVVARLPQPATEDCVLSSEVEVRGR